MTRTFGVELEIVHSGDQHAGFVGRVTRSLRNAGLASQTIEQQHYGANNYSTWQINRDSSVSRNYIPGAEVVSRILPATDEGFAEVALACDLIAAAGATVNRTCGMHVHVDVRDLTVDEIRRVVIAYVRFQAEIDSVVPQSRRGNQYCRHMTSTWRTADSLTASLEQCFSVSQMADVIGGKYYVLNLSKFVYTGTIEFRQHSGTVEATKAVSWARWCVAFVETFRHVAPVAAAACDGEVLERHQGRGEVRLPSRGPSLAIIRRLQAGPAHWEELAALTPQGQDDADATVWLKWCANRYGVSVARTAAGWQLDNGQAASAAAASPFETCFTPGGQIGYFGRRRRALSR